MFLLLMDSPGNKQNDDDGDDDDDFPSASPPLSNAQTVQLVVSLYPQQAAQKNQQVLTQDLLTQKVKNLTKITPLLSYYLQYCKLWLIKMTI